MCLFWFLWFLRLFCVLSRSCLSLIIRPPIFFTLSCLISPPFTFISVVIRRDPVVIFVCPECLCLCPSAPIRDPSWLFFVPMHSFAPTGIPIYSSVAIFTHRSVSLTYQSAHPHYTLTLGKFPRSLVIMNVPSRSNMTLFVPVLCVRIHLCPPALIHIHTRAFMTLLHTCHHHTCYLVFLSALS